LVDRSEARVDYDRALHHALRARASEISASLPADAVEAVLLAALTRQIASIADTPVGENATP
jgi:hypothetical protein